MNEEEKYLFDINGYIVVRDVLTADEISAANAAIDHTLQLERTAMRDITNLMMS